MTSMIDVLETAGEQMPPSEFARCMENALGRSAPELQENELLTAMLGSQGSQKLLLAA